MGGDERKLIQHNVVRRAPLKEMYGTPSPTMARGQETRRRDRDREREREGERQREGLREGERAEEPPENHVSDDRRDK